MKLTKELILSKARLKLRINHWKKSISSYLKHLRKVKKSDVSKKSWYIRWRKNLLNCDANVKKMNNIRKINKQLLIVKRTMMIKWTLWNLKKAKSKLKIQLLQERSELFDNDYINFMDNLWKFNFRVKSHLQRILLSHSRSILNATIMPVPLSILMKDSSYL